MMAPLLIGADVRTLDQKYVDILTNKDVIAIDQDLLGVQGKRIIQDGFKDVIVKPLLNGDIAVVLFNKDYFYQRSIGVKITEAYSKLGIKTDKSLIKYKCTDLWTKQVVEVVDDLVADNIDPGSVKMYRCSKGQ